MSELTKEERSFLVQALSQISFKPGQSALLALAESIIAKVGAGLKEVEQKQ